MNNLKAFQEYLEFEKKYSLHTVNAYVNDLIFFEEFLKNNFESLEFEKVSYAIIRSWIVNMINDGMSNTSVNRKLSSLKSFYKFLLKIKQIEINPLQKHLSLKTPKKIQIPFSEKELDDVLNNLNFPQGFDGVRDKLIIDLFYATGIRRTELINLKIQNIDLKSSTMKVLGKRNKERILPILPVVESQIKNYLIERAKIECIKDSDFFFLML